ncbi:hypothetical protein CEXT_689951 [Caerostris extrusa]|uniref:Uncharacterized protein n=1 Tax=Caerostris extrusa TaxID=172846 RepID=A0AAV4T7W9_CAEEX|nr:hypothetical protein CEXT_689951 [Caerostris extrusa]
MSAEVDTVLLVSREKGGKSPHRLGGGSCLLWPATLSCGRAVGGLRRGCRLQGWSSAAPADVRLVPVDEEEDGAHAGHLAHHEAAHGQDECSRSGSGTGALERGLGPQLVAHLGLERRDVDHHARQDQETCKLTPTLVNM